MKRLKLIFMLVICMVILVSCENESVDTPVDTTASNSEEQEDVRYPSPVNDGEHPSLIAHAGGAVYGYRLTNSLEALDASYENGFRVFDEHGNNITPTGLDESPYYVETKSFLDAIINKTAVPAENTPESTMDTIRLALAETQSCDLNGALVDVK